MHSERASVYRFTQTRTSATATVAFDHGTPVERETLDVHTTADHVMARRRLRPLPEKPSSPVVEREGYLTEREASDGGPSGRAYESLIVGPWYAPVKVESLQWTLDAVPEASSSQMSSGHDSRPDEPSHSHPMRPPEETAAGRGRQASSSDEGGWSSEGGSSFAMVTPDAGSEEEHSLPLSGPLSWQRKWTTGWGAARRGRGNSPAASIAPKQKTIAESSSSALSETSRAFIFTLTIEKDTPAIWPRLISCPPDGKPDALDGTSWAALGEHYLDDEHNVIKALQPLIFASMPPNRHLLAQSRLLCDCLGIGTQVIPPESLTWQAQTAAMDVVHTYYPGTSGLDLAAMIGFLSLDLAESYGDPQRYLPDPPRSASTLDPQRYRRKLLTAAKAVLETGNISAAALRDAYTLARFDGEMVAALEEPFQPLAWSEPDPSEPAADEELAEDPEHLLGSTLLAASTTTSQDPLLETVAEREQRQALRRRRRKRRQQEKERQELRKRLLGRGDDAKRHTHFIAMATGAIVVIIGLVIWRRKTK